MTIVKALLLGLIAGCTAFLPVSSAGSVMIAGGILSADMSRRLFLMIMLGVLLAAVLVFLQDFVRLGYSLVCMIRDSFAHLDGFLHPGRKKSRSAERRIISGNYRKFAVMLLISLVPMLLIGILLRQLAGFAYGNMLAIGMGFLLTALIQLVSSFMNGNAKTPKVARFSDALIIGFFQGASFLPGVSRVGIASSAGYLCGFTRKFAMRYTYILSSLGILFLILPGLLRPAQDIWTDQVGWLPCILAMIVSFLAAFSAMRFAAKRLSRKNNRVFAVCNLILGVVSAVIYLVG